MQVIKKRPYLRNLRRKSISFSKEQYAILENPDIESRVDVYNRDTRELEFSIKKDRYPLLKPELKPSYSGVEVVVCDCVDALDASIAIEPKVTEFMTQAEIAEHYKIHQCRIAILVDCGWLAHDHKVGKTFMYKTADVMDLMNNSTFVTWLNNQHERVQNV